MIPFAHLPEVPTGKDILAAAKAAKYVKARRATAKNAGKSCSFTPAEIVVHAPQAVGAGVILGRIDTKLPGDETDLPAGEFDIYLANINGTWRAYAETRGKTVTEAKHVTVQTVQRRATRATPKPLFHPHGWCWSHTFHIRYKDKHVNVKLDLTISVCF